MVILYYFINVPVLGEQNKKKYIPSNYNVTYIIKCMYSKYILI